MSWLLDPFQLAIQQRALIGGALAAVMLAIVGTWVVLRGMTFLGDALVHGVVPGIAVALIAGFDLRIGAIAAAILMMVGILLTYDTIQKFSSTVKPPSQKTPG